MFLKLLWILVIGWIAFRVYVAGRNIFRIAFGQGGNPLPGPGEHPTGRPAPNHEAQSPPREPPSDVEDARWVDL